MQTDERLTLAAQAYAEGYTCSQSVFRAYAEDLGIDIPCAMRLMEGFGGGMGGLQEVCGALSAACAVISCCRSRGECGDAKNRAETYRCVREAAAMFRGEYGGVTCKDVLRGEAPKPRQCGMKVKDAVLIVQQIVGSDFNPREQGGNAT